MAWQDRPYYGGGDTGGYLSNPANLLGFSLPFGNWGPVRVRLNFWLLLSILFLLIAYVQIGSLSMGIVHCAMLIAACLLHEYGNRFAAHQVGGTHDDFMLWPAGGAIPPSCPPTPFATLVSHSGGVLTNLLIAAACTLVLWFIYQQTPPLPLNPLSAFGNSAPPLRSAAPAALLAQFMYVNAAVMWAALMPYYWFKGAYILQSILWKWTGYKQAVNVTCIVGMVIAAPMFLFAMWAGSFLGMVLWALLFASSFSRRKQVQFEPESNYQDSLTWTEKRWGSKKRRPSAFTKWRQQRAADRRQDLQAQVDRILEKVSRDGMHSLTAREKKTLEEASRELQDH